MMVMESNSLSWNTVETRYNEVLGTETFCLLYIRYFFYISSKKQYKTEQLISLGLDKFVCYVRYIVLYQIVYINTGQWLVKMQSRD